MASATVGTLRVILSADTAQYQAGMKRAADVAGALSKDWKSIGQQATQVGSALTKAFTVPLLGVGVGAAKLAIDFQSSFANVAKTVDGVSDKAGKLTSVGEALAMTFRQMAKEIPATTDELTKIAALGGQMGVPIEQLAHFTRNVAALGVAVDGISTEEAASGLASIGNATGTGTTKIAEMASALVHLGNNSNATEGDILEFTKRLIGAGHSVGMTVPDVMALSTAMANVGIKAEAGGTAMSTVISKISSAVSKGGADLDEFAKVAGKSADEFAATWKRSPIEAMDLFIKGLGRMRGEGVDLNLTMGEIGTEGIRVASTLKLLAGAGDGVAKSMVLANEGFASGNKHLDEATKKYATTENQLKLLWNRIKDVGITLGNALLPAINMAIGGADKLIPVIDTLAKMFAALPTGVQGVVIGLGLLLAAVGPVIFIFGQMAISASALIGVFGKKGLATRALAIDQGTLAVSSTKLTTSLGLLTKAASLASAALIGWEVGRLIAQLTGLDQKIADTITGLNNLTRARELSAQGKGAEAQADVTRRLTELENQRKAAIIGLNFATAALIAKQIEALKNDQTRLAIQDTINAAIGRGATATITYTEAVKFNSEWDKKRTDGLTAQAAAQQAAGRETETAAQKLDRMAQAQATITAANKKYTQDLTGIKDALRLQIENMDKTGFTVEKLAKEYGISKETVSRFKSELDAGEKALVKTGKAATKHTEEIVKLGQAYSGAADVLSAMDAMAAVNANLEKGITIAQMSGAQQRQLADDLKAGIDHYERWGQVAPKAWVATELAARTAIDAWKDVPTMIGMTVRQAEQIIAGSTLYKLTKPVVNDPEIVPLPFLGGLTIAQVRSMFENFKYIPQRSGGPADPENVPLPMIGGLTIAQVKIMFRDFSMLPSPQKFVADLKTGAFGDVLVKNLKNTLLAIPKLIADSFLAGDVKGGIIASAKLLGATVGDTIGKAIGGPLGDIVASTFRTGKVREGLVAAASHLGGELGGKLGLAIGGPLGAAIGKALGQLAGPLLDKLLGLFGLGTAGRDLVKDFAASHGGFDALHAELGKLNKDGDQAGERLWIALTQGVGRNNPQQAKAAIDAVTAALEAQAQKQADAAAAATETGDAQVEASSAALDAIKKLDDELKSLYQSIENEAPEEVMGVIEANTRARIEAVQKERDAAQQAMDAAAETSRQTTQTAAEALATAAENAAKRIEDAFNGLYRDRPPIKFDAELHWGNYRPPPRDPPLLAKGGIVPSYFDAGGLASVLRPKGTDTVAAMLTPGEGVLNVPAMRIVGREQLEALNAGRVSSQSWRGESQPAQAAAGSRDLNVYVTVQGDVVDKQTPRKLAIEIAKEINHGGEPRTVWEREIASMARVRVDA